MARLHMDNVGKQYRTDFWGMRHFTLDVESGILGLLGPNGAGKSTLMRMLATVMKPTEGAIHWNGVDTGRSPDGIRRVLGYLPQDFGVYPNLDAMEFLHYLSAAKGMQSRDAAARINELLSMVNLIEVRKRPLGEYSGGMKQRIGIAQALLNDPAILIVDEPTAGLDPEERVRFRHLLAELAADRIVILSTHIVSDVEASASEIVIVKKGALVVHATPDKLIEAVAGRVWEWRAPDSDVVSLRQRFLVSGTARRDGALRVRVIAPEQPVDEARAVQPTLEDAYLFYVGDRQSGGV